ncbi:unnamed protein product [Gordionus sp. m RMFG-2023]
MFKEILLILFVSFEFHLTTEWIDGNDHHHINHINRFGLWNHPYHKRIYSHTSKYPEFDPQIFKNLVAPVNTPTDIIILWELAYDTTGDYDCAMCLYFGTMFFKTRNNPLDQEIFNLGIISYYKYSKITLPLKKANTFVKVVQNGVPMATFNATDKSLDLGNAMTLAENMFNNLSETSSKKTIWVYISGPNDYAAMNKAKYLKNKGFEIFVFAFSTKVNIEQLYDIATSPSHILWFSDYCTASQTIYNM